MAKEQAASRRTYISQTDVPSWTLDQALRVPRAIIENYAGRPARPLNVAQAMDVSPTSGPFRALCGAAIAYGLTEGGCNATTISATSLAKRIISPTKEGDDAIARREAFLKPRVPIEFLTRYDGQRLPKPHIAANVLSEMGVPRDRTEEMFQILTTGAEQEGLLREIKGERYVDLRGMAANSAPSGSDEEVATPIVGDTTEEQISLPAGIKEMLNEVSENTGQPASVNQRKLRVYISHGKNRAFVDPLKDVAGLLELEPVVSIQQESTAIPVPEKVMAEMRSCGGAIIHIDDEATLQDAEGQPRIILNANVLIEIGAAMALYGKRFIVLCKKGIDLPSNLQGLYRIDHPGETLNGDDMMKLLKAVKELKSYPLPDMP